MLFYANYLQYFPLNYMLERKRYLPLCHFTQGGNFTLIHETNITSSNCGLLRMFHMGLIVRQI